MNKRTISGVLATFLGGAMFLSGCSGVSGVADLTNAVTDSNTLRAVQAAGVTVNEPEEFSSVSGYFVTPEPVATVEPEESTEPEESSEPTSAESYTCDVDMLNLVGNFMSPKSLEGIDPYNDKVVAITFDDGPFKETTPRLLEILKDNDVNATFFMVGEYAAQNPDIVREAYENGNEIGTHSWDHSSNFLKWSYDEVMDQITRTNDAIEEATGLRTIIDRPPEGAINADVAASIGRMQILWDVDPNDWKTENRDPDIVYDNVVNGGEMHDGALVLSHDIRPTTVDAYDRIIKELKDEGYKFVTISQLIQIAQLRGKDLSYVFNGSPSAAKAAEDGYTAETPNGSSGDGDSGTAGASSGGDSSQEA